MTCTGMSTYDAMQIITAFLSNVGIGFGGFGPTDAFGSMSDGAKCVAMVDMLLGRLNYLQFLLCFILNSGKGIL